MCVYVCLIDMSTSIEMHKSLSASTGNNLLGYYMKEFSKQQNSLNAHVKRTLKCGREIMNIVSGHEHCHVYWKIVIGRNLDISVTSLRFQGAASENQ